MADLKKDIDEYFTKPNARLVYTGMILDGKANGKGCYKFRNGTIVVACLRKQI